MRNISLLLLLIFVVSCTSLGARLGKWVEDNYGRKREFYLEQLRDGTSLKLLEGEIRVIFDGSDITEHCSVIIETHVGFDSKVGHVLDDTGAFTVLTENSKNVLAGVGCYIGEPVQSFSYEFKDKDFVLKEKNNTFGKLSLYFTSRDGSTFDLSNDPCSAYKYGSRPLLSDVRYGKTQLKLHDPDADFVEIISCFKPLSKKKMRYISAN